MAKIQFYPYDLDYKEVDNNSVVYLFGRSSKGKRITVIDDTFIPYFLVKSKQEGDFDNLMTKIGKLKLEEDQKSFSGVEKQINYEVLKTENITKKSSGKEINLIKVYVNNYKAISKISKIVQEWDSIKQIYEHDIPFLRRYLVDKGITPITLVEVEGEFIAQKSRGEVFKAKSIKQFSEDAIKEPRMLGFDIETYNPDGKAIEPDKYPIIMVSFYGKDYEKVITWKKFKTNEKYIEFVDSEVELIEKIKEVIEHYKPEALVGYFSDGFDLPYIETRAKKYKIKLDLGLDYSNLSINGRDKTDAKIKGIMHLDIFSFIRRVISRTMKTERYDLSSVSEELLGEKKIDVDLERLSDVWDNKPKELEIYCKYNLKDSILVYNLAKKVMPNMLELVKIVGMLPYKVARMGFSQLVESYLLNQSYIFNELIPSRPNHEDIKQRRMITYKGAFVYEPKAGMYENIAILDYRSLYPTIISSHNISPETLDCTCCGGKKTPDEKYWFCEKKKGFIPLVVDDLITRRMRIKEMIAKKDKKDAVLAARSEALKVLANSLYGYYGFFGARWYCMECAKSITAWGRYYIHNVIDKAEKAGFKVIYSDTDSVFLLMGNLNKKDIDKFISQINVELPGLMELEYEGLYTSGIFVSMKGKETGAKKKYAMISEDGTLKITGFETVRRNWSLVAKNVQKKILEMILKEKDVEKALKYVKKIIDELRKNKVGIEKVMISTQLKKNVEDYIQIGPHVAVAKRMKGKGIDVGAGSMIRYVIMKGKGMIRDRARMVEEIGNEKYDSDYYINHQVVPAVESIFSVFNIKKEDIASEKEQSGLSDFF
ncbi:ribonuclease H-like domain-containing protein [Candidatus Woesearchaeota archaeon]|nr:ribonuclease H-like domain-containing protein [Candidatus Woesearchaeota archaeon]